MQMTMTFAFADPGEAGIFFAEMAKVLSNTGSALSALFRQSAPPATTPPAATSVPSVKPAAVPTPASIIPDTCVAPLDAEPEQAPVADAAPAEQKARRRRKTSEAHDVSSAVASGGKDPAAESGASDVKDVKKAEAPSGSSVTVDQIRKAVNAVATDPSAGGAAAVMKVLSKYGAARIPDIKEGDLRKVAEDLANLSEKAKLVLLDEIPF